MSLEFLHTMVRVHNLDQSLHFYKDILGMIEVSRKDIEKGRYTLVFLAASHDERRARDNKAPMLELTYNWPDEDGNAEKYDTGRNFGHLAYRVDNIYEFCDRVMAAGVTINRPPHDGRMAFIKSPDGVSIELLQKGDALEPQEPWLSMQKTGSW